MKQTDEKIERLERKVSEQQQCLRDKDRRLTRLERKIRNIKKTGGIFLLLIPFLLLICLTIYFCVTTIGVFEMVPYNVDFRHNPQSLPFILYTGVTIVAEVILFGWCYEKYIE